MFESRQFLMKDLNKKQKQKNKYTVYSTLWFVSLLRLQLECDDELPALSM